MTHFNDTNAKLMIRLAEKKLLEAYPFYARLINSWQKISADCDTMGVAIKESAIHLSYNPEFVSRLTLESLCATLIHEANHVVLGHVHLDPRRFGNSNALMVACEVSANEFVRDSQDLPGSPLLLKDWNLPPGESTIKRYHRLYLDLRCAKPHVKAMDNHGQWGNSDAGQTRRQKRMINTLIEKALTGMDSEHLNELPLGILKAINSISTQGTVAGKITEALTGKRRSGISWYSILQPHFNVVRKPDFSWPPRRMPHLTGIIPGHRLSRKKLVVMAAVDTSGSMDISTINAIKAELDHIASFTRVILVQCDTEISNITPDYKPGGLVDIQGRGGTDLCPPFSLFNQYPVGLMIYFTDGQGPGPPTQPHIPVIWCLSQEGSPPVSWGRVVKMKQ